MLKPMSFSPDVELWREYVKQSGTFSKAMTDQQAKRRLQVVASGFARIANDDVRHWRDCAKQARALSKTMARHKTKHRMLAIAAKLDHVGDLASKLQSPRQLSNQTPRSRRRRLPI